MVDAGMKIVVITAQDLPAHHIEFLEGIEIHYLPVHYENRFGFYRRIYSFFNYVTKATRLSKKFKDFDLCYAISVPLSVGLIALRLKSKYKIPFVFEVGDLWPDAPIDLGFVKNPILKKGMFWLEHKIYGSASSIVALSPAIAERIAAKVRGQKSIAVVPNMADTEFFSVEKKKTSLESKYKVGGKFVVSYVGAIGYANGLDYLLACARVSQRTQANVHYLICGEGAMLAGLKKSASLLQLKNVSFLPFADREGVKEIMNVTDACMVCYRPEEILRTGSPNKYFDGLAAGKAIIINFEGWIKEEIEKEQCGIAGSSASPDRLAEMITALALDPERLQLYQQNARKVAEQKYSRQILGRKVIDVVRR